MRQRELAERPGVDARADAVAERLRGLADPVRLRLLGLLARGDCPVSSLASALDIGQSLVSFHLTVLRETGLVATERVGRFTYVRLVPRAIGGLFDQVAEVVAPEGQVDLALTADERALVHDVVGELPTRLAALLGAARVEAVVREEVLRRPAGGTEAAPGGARHARERAEQRLRALAQAEGRQAKQVPEVLFVCVRNAGRSQMAAALAEQLAGGRVHAWSAGSHPAGQVHDEAVAVMAELGIDLSRTVPRPWTNELVRAADVVVTMGCGDDCPVFPGVRYLDWDVPDPAGRPLDEARRIRDDLQRRVQALLDELTD